MLVRWVAVEPGNGSIIKFLFLLIFIDDPYSRAYLNILVRQVINLFFQAVKRGFVILFTLPGKEYNT
jgi:hypothetical protein